MPADPSSIPPAPPGRRCPVRACRRPLQRTLFVCHDHWFAIPRGQRDAIHAAYYRYREQPTLSSLHQLTAAQQLALDTLEAS